MKVGSPRLPLALTVVLPLFMVAPPSSSGSPPASPPNTDGIHAILVFDTLKGPSGVEFNRFLIDQMLRTVRDMGFRVDVTQLEPRQISPGAIVAAIRRLDQNQMRNRTLLFYYAGHGGTDRRFGHFLSTSGGDLPRSALVAEIQAKRPGLALILTDSCSVEAKLNAPAVVPPPPPERRAVENLLFQHRGLVDINAATYRPELGIKQAAFYYPGKGGIFTSAFITMFKPAVPDIYASLRGYGPLFEATPEAIDYGRRFNAGKAWEYDRDRDGFLEWSEAIDYLNATVFELFEEFKGCVRGGSVSVRANPKDVQLLISQRCQDPQVFGALAVRSDRPMVADAVAPQAARRPRFGAFTENRQGRGGQFIEVTGVEARSPATRVYVWKNGRRSRTPLSMAVTDSIIYANKVRVKTREDLFRAMDAVPFGGELNITGYDASTGGRAIYQATVVLDSYE